MRLWPNPPGLGLGLLSCSCSSGEEGVGGKPQTRLWARVAERERVTGPHLTAGQGDPLGSQDMALVRWGRSGSLPSALSSNLAVYCSPRGLGRPRNFRVCCRSMTMPVSGPSTPSRSPELNSTWLSLGYSSYYSGCAEPVWVHVQGGMVYGVEYGKVCTHRCVCMLAYVYRCGGQS